MLYKCDSCGRTEESDGNPPKCPCGLPEFITLMKPVESCQENNEINEYLAE